MTAIYDGILGVSSKVVQPCCSTMHRHATLGTIYINTRGTLCMRTSEKSGQPICCCPFCGARTVML